MKYPIAAALLLVAAPSAAAVKSSDAHSFVVENSVVLKGSPARAWSAFGEVGKWWSDEHTFSRNAGNMRLDLTPGGCWCETFAGGGAQFMRVVMARPPKELVLSGALGPMLYDVAPATMIVRFEPQGSDTKVTITYEASGFVKGDADKTAPLVDQVLAEQLKRFAAFAGNAG